MQHFCLDSDVFSSFISLFTTTPGRIYHIFFHVLRLNKSNTGSISSLPNIMVRVNIIFEKPLYAAKFA